MSPYNIGDLLALSLRSRYGCVNLKGDTYSKDDLLSLHTELVRQIGKTIRYGYKEEDTTKGIPESIGTIDKPIVQIQNHREFVKALIYSKANLFSRSSISIFTTNYDTLMEDALALEKICVNDGFCGAAIGFWNPDVSYGNISGINMIKLHGSVDWIKDLSTGLIRNRYGVEYIGASEDVLIYPQATKYIETQKDPFALLFTKFRERLNSSLENLLICVGYSFGDQHINSEIDIAIKTQKNKTTLVVFIDNLNGVLTNWVKDITISERIFIATSQGIYHGSETLICDSTKPVLNWWRFSELIKFIKDGDPL